MSGWILLSGNGFMPGKMSSTIPRLSLRSQREPDRGNIAAGASGGSVKGERVFFIDGFAVVALQYAEVLEEMVLP